jgi:integrase
VLQKPDNSKSYRQAPRTVGHVHRIAHRALGQAKAWGVIRDNIAEQVKPPPVPDRELPILQPDRARALLAALDGKPLYLLAALALATGARRNELLALRWQDVDLDAGRLRIERALEETRAHGIRVKAPKTRHGRRSISLPAATVEALRVHWREQQEQRMELGMGRARDDDLLLAAYDGRAQSPNAVTHAWAEAMRAIGMPEVTVHSLRHTHASMLIASGMDVLTVSRRLGHATPTITLQVYGHVIHGADDRAAEIMDAAFGSKMVADRSKTPRNTR